MAQAGPGGVARGERRDHRHAREGGGWLVLDKGYQDVAFYASFRCSGACKTGVLLRAEKTADGMKGVYVSLSDGDVASYEVSWTRRGRR